ncbi:solute carrier family 23 protein [Marinobacter fuscus]|uniref:solute carrier family 23 protein n=1 Tax=Marinobacter fuscus TaxID=2109942 RepID=UPI001F0C23F4|nr:solute carrier family 23 protein [Marinobacter fuscus]
MSPKFSALITTIPFPVLGGATITVFGMISLTGIQLLIKDELSSRNMTIVGLSLALSMGISSVPEATALFPDVLKSIIGGSPIVVAAFVAFTLNIILPKMTLADEKKEREAMEEEDREESENDSPSIHRRTAATSRA